jgi:hypothetical protein
MHHSHIRQCPLYIIVRGEDGVGLDLGSILQIKVANAVNAARIHELSIARFQHALKRDQPHHKEGGNDHHAKHEKGRSQVGDLSHKGHGNQSA